MSLCLCSPFSDLPSTNLFCTCSLSPSMYLWSHMSVLQSLFCTCSFSPSMYLWSHLSVLLSLFCIHSLVHLCLYHPIGPSESRLYLFFQPISITVVPSICPSKSLLYLFSAHPYISGPIYLSIFLTLFCICSLFPCLSLWSHLSVLLSLFCILSPLVTDRLYLSKSNGEHSYFQIYGHPLNVNILMDNISSGDSEWCDN